MKKIKIVGLGIFFSLFIVACSSPSSSSSPTSPKESQGQLSADPSSISFTYGQTSFQTSQVTSAQNGGTGAYSAKIDDDDESIAKVDINSVGLVQIIPVGVGDVVITVEKAGDNTFDATSIKIPVTITKAEQNLAAGVPEGRYFISKDTTSAIRIASNVFGGVKGDQDLSNLKDDDKNKGTYSINIESSATIDTTAGVIKGVLLVNREILGSTNTIDELIIKAITGDATITLTRTGDDNYKDSTVSVYVTVNDKATQDSLSFVYAANIPITTDITTDNYNSFSIIPAVLQSQEHSVKSSNPLVATAIKDGVLFTIKPLRAGVAMITVTRAGDENTNPVSKSILVTINKPTNTTFSSEKSGFTAIYNKEVDTTSTVFNNSFSIGDFFPKSLRPDVATASTNNLSQLVITLEEVGTTDISVIVASDHKYLESELKPKVRVTVDQAPQTLVAETPNNTYRAVFEDNFATVDITGGQGDGKFGFSNEIDVGVSSTSTDIATGKISLEGVLTITFGNAGTATLDIIKDSDRNYTAGLVKVTVIIAKQIQSLKVANKETTITVRYGSDPEDIEITGGKGTGEYVVSSDATSVATAEINKSSGILTISFAKTASGIGDASIIIYKQGNNNYLLSNTVEVAVAVTAKDNQEIVIGNSDFNVIFGADDATTSIYTTTTNDVPIVSSSSWIITDGDNSVATGDVTDATDDYLTVNFKQFGQTTFYIRRAADATYNPSRLQAITVEVSKAPQIISATPSDFELIFSETDTTTFVVSGGKSDGAYQLTVSDASIIDVKFVDTQLVTTNINPATVTITTLKSGESNIKIYRQGDRNYQESNPITITTEVSKADQIDIITDSTSFILRTGDPTTATITRLDGSDITIGGNFSVVISDKDVATAEINETGTLSITAVGSGKTIITVSKLGNDKYSPSNSIDISVDVLRADQTLTASLPIINNNKYSFAKAGLSVTADIQGGLGTGAYVAISQSTDIASVDIDPISGLLTIDSIATGDTTVTIKKEEDTKYNESNILSIAIRVKKQQTLLSLLPTSLSTLTFGTDATTQISGGDGTGYYVINVTGNNVVAASTNDRNQLVITPRRDGDATIDIFKKGDGAYNLSNTVSIAVSVIKGDSDLAYDYQSSIEYSANEDPIEIEFSGSAVSAPNTPTGNGEFSFVVTASADSLTIANASIQQTTGVITYTPLGFGKIQFVVTRAGTNQYEEETVTLNISVTRIPQTLEAELSGSFGSNGDLTFGTIGIITIISNPDAGGTYKSTTTTNDVISSISSGSSAISPTNGRATISPQAFGDTDVTITRIQTPQYAGASVTVGVSVKRATKAITVTRRAGFDNLDRLTYGTDASVKVNLVISGAIYTIIVQESDKTTATVKGNDGGLDKNGEFTIAPVGAGDVNFTITRQENMQYEFASTFFNVVVKRATQTLSAVFSDDFDNINNDDTSADLTYLKTGTVTITATNPAGVDRGTIAYAVASGSAAVATATDPDTGTGEFIITAEGAGDATFTVTRERTDRYEEASVNVGVSVKRATLTLSAEFTSGFENFNGGDTRADLTFLETGIVTITATNTVATVLTSGSYTIDGSVERNLIATALSVGTDGVLTITPVGAGSASFVITREQDLRYEAASVNVGVSVKRAAGELSLDDAALRTLDDALVFRGDSQTIQLNPEITAVYEVSSNTKPNIATVEVDSNGLITIEPASARGTIEVGGVDFTIIRAATDQYLAATISKRVTVGKGEFTDATVSVNSEAIVDETINLAYTVSTDIVIGGADTALFASIEVSLFDADNNVIRDGFFNTPYVDQDTNTITVSPLVFIADTDNPTIKITLSNDDLYDTTSITLFLKVKVSRLISTQDASAEDFATVINDDESGYIFALGSNNLTIFEVDASIVRATAVTQKFNGSLPSIEGGDAIINANGIAAFKDNNKITVFVTGISTNNPSGAVGAFDASIEETMESNRLTSRKIGSLAGANNPVLLPDNTDLVVLTTSGLLKIGVVASSLIYSPESTINSIATATDIIYYAEDGKLGGYSVSETGTTEVLPGSTTVGAQSITAAQYGGSDYVFAADSSEVYAYNSTFFTFGIGAAAAQFEVSGGSAIATTTLSRNAVEVFLVFVVDNNNANRVTILEFTGTDFESRGSIVNDTLNLGGTISIDTLKVGGKTFLVVGSDTGSKISIFELK